MSRRQRNPLRTLTTDERRWLQRIARSTSEPASHVARAKQLLAVSDGHTYTAAARLAGRNSNDAVAQLVARFNDEGMRAIEPRRGGGRRLTYKSAERERILREARRAPDPERDATSSWSLMTLRRALRRAEDGLPAVSTYTIRAVLREAGWSWPRTRTWCETGASTRKRKSGERVTVVDVDAAAKKS
jgi:hypothetical protein